MPEPESGRGKESDSDAWAVPIRRPSILVTDTFSPDFASDTITLMVWSVLLTLMRVHTLPIA